MNGRCETCKFAKKFSYVPEPPEPKEEVPRKGWKAFFFGDRKDRWEREIEAIHRYHAMKPWLQYKNNIMCQRFPEFVEKSKNDICGEYEYKS